MPSRSERIAIAALGGFLLLVRIAAFFRYRFDSDEPQHLHVAWGWTQGLVQYRDLFDNHAPLFHMLSAPYLVLFGERPDILFFMRALMIPLWIFVAAGTWIIARRFYSTRVAVWAVLILHLFPTFFLKSLEYRTDNLWCAIWIAVLLVLTRGDLTPRRMFAVGLLLGICACVSLKTSLLIFTLLLAGGTTYFFTIEQRSPREIARVLLPALAGLVIVPTAVALLFVHLGAWPNLVYCNFTFNGLIAHTKPHAMRLRELYPFVLIMILVAARERAAGKTFDRDTRWRYFLAVACLMFSVTLACFWILISARDFLAILPLFAIVGASAVDNIRFRIPVLAIWTLLCLHGLQHYTNWLKNDTRELTTMIDQVLHLTRPGEPLMDFKGETIFRRRPYYYILELIGRTHMKRGLIPDTVARDMIAARCHVAQADGQFWPDASGEFLRGHYIDVGRLRASGNWIGENGSFDVAIPATYVMLDKSGKARGMLDGVPYTGPRELAAGPHRFVRETNERVAWLWAPAYERGFSPFHLRDRDF